MNEDVASRILSWLAVMAAASAGRMMHHAYQVQRGKRKFWSTALTLDLIIAVGMGLIAYGFGAYFNLSDQALAGASAAAGYLGPHSIEAIVNRKLGIDEKKEETQ